jgi:hypothetical protein
MNRVHGNNNNCDNKSEIERVQRLWLRLAVVPVKMVRSQQEVLSTNTELDRRLQSITMSLLCISILRGCLKMMRCRFYCNRVLLQQGSTATGFYCNRVLLQQGSTATGVARPHQPRASCNPSTDQRKCNAFLSLALEPLAQATHNTGSASPVCPRG